MAEAKDTDAHERAKIRMDAIDALSPELRACVHDFGWTVVHAFLQCGVKKPKHIRHLVARVREGGVEIGKRS